MRQEQMEEAEADALVYTASEFGAPVNVCLNGVHLKAVQSIEVKHHISGFSDVTIHLGGTLVEITPETSRARSRRTKGAGPK